MTTQPQEDWKESLEKWKEHFYYYVSLADGYKYSKKEMLDEIDSILLSQENRIREEMKQKAITCVPEDPRKKLIYGRDTSYDIENANGFNDCREQTLSAIKEL